MKGAQKISLILLSAVLMVVLASNTNCGVYRFNEAGSVPDSIKTVKVLYLENRAQYVNPQFSPKLTDKLRQKIVGQTKLSQTNGDNADWEISGYVREYTFSTSAISGQQASNNRLTVTVHITLNDRKSGATKEHDVTRSVEFPGNQTFQQAETSKMDELIRILIDDIFNKLFSDW
ncbi:MAG: LptE family protein [Chitinophagaceae bacterium]